MNTSVSSETTETPFGFLSSSNRLMSEDIICLFMSCFQIDPLDSNTFVDNNR